MREQSCLRDAGCPSSVLGSVCLAAGVAIGALAMYFGDPNRGRLRRARLQQQATGAVRRGGEELTGRAEDLLNRAHGLVAKAGDWFECKEQVSDDVLAARVRSRLGHLTQEADTIESSVKDGIVRLGGALGTEKRRILAGIWGIPGVQDVHVWTATATAKRA